MDHDELRSQLQLLPHHKQRRPLSTEAMNSNSRYCTRRALFTQQRGIALEMVTLHVSHHKRDPQ